MVGEAEVTANNLVLEARSLGIICVASRFDQIVRVIVLSDYGSSVHGKPPKGLGPSNRLLLNR